MRQLTVALTAVAVAVAAAVLGLFLWLRTYAPLSGFEGGTFGPGAGLGADVEPTFGSGGKTVYIPAYKKGRPFDTTFTITNTGRFAVTVKGLSGDKVGPIAADALLDPGHKRPIHELRIDAHETALVIVRWRLDCTDEHVPGGEASTDNVRLRYSYLSLFSRSQLVVLPFAVTLRCHGGPPPTP